MGMLEEMTEKLFVKDGKPLKLANNKSVESIELDDLKEIFRPKSTTN